MPRFKNRNSRYQRKRSGRKTSRKSKTSYKSRRTNRRKPMTKKRILDVTSRKKRNGMLTLSNTTATGTRSSIATQPLVALGNATTRTLFCMTAQDLVSGAGGPDSTITQEAARTATTTYSVGFSETLRMTSSTDIPWFHRRIVFASKSDLFLNYSPADVPQDVSPYIHFDGPQGQQRLMFNLGINASANTINGIDEVVFKGASGVDWNDVIVAPLDTRRIDVMYDRTFTLRSGNSRGTTKERKFWHPVYKNVVYNDDESGITEPSSRFSVRDKRGAGDIYVYDLYQSTNFGTNTDMLQVYGNSTYYWHEK